MEQHYVIGVDIGTQGTKTALFSVDGQKVAESFEKSELICPAPGEVCQEPEEIYGSVVRTIRQSIERAGVPKEKILALGMDSQMAGIMAVDKDFKAVGPYDSWLDTRCAPYIMKMKQQAEDEIIRKTGGPVTCTHGPKILHRKYEFPQEYARIAKFVLPGTYVAGRLCGLKAEDAYIDYTHLHFTGFADNQNKSWDSGLLMEFGIEKEKMPDIVSPWKVVGALTKAAAEESGLSEGTKVVAGCGDSAASALGAGIVEKNMIYDVAGTASIFACSTDNYTPDQNEKTILFSRSVIDGLYTPLAYISGGGLCLKWFLEQHGESYAYWNREAEKIEAGSRGLYFVPHFSGRTCPGVPDMRGAFSGLSFYHQAGHMYRSILESIAYEYHLYFSILKEQNPHIAPQAIYGAGGGTKSGIFNQIKADVLGIPYRPLEDADTAVYASAMLAAFGIGRIPDLKAAMKVQYKEEIYMPQKGNSGLYKGYAKQYARLLKLLGEFY
ncbi:xylulokinase [Faecalicatena orotica]|uniref:Xylulokinase n=1 Tax=Faecalicatena orotica TaxID=1544 RepID=A0A2Y9BJF6_9FIRM|nr:FGGY family carbohydrate kinase [Faecalicatena orotica]PWJ23690.1 xylulokinase [Faecalicatena orotica]SSA57602.1 xylulokinase [Faecalicatena orotica]